MGFAWHRWSQDDGNNQFHGRCCNVVEYDVNGEGTTADTVDTVGTAG